MPVESPHCLRGLVWSGQIGPAGAQGKLASPGDGADGFGFVFALVSADRCSIVNSVRVCLMEVSGSCLFSDP